MQSKSGSTGGEQTVTWVEREKQTAKLVGASIGRPRAGLSRNRRQNVAAELSRLLGKPLTKQQLDRWSAPCREKSRLPAAYLWPLAQATGDDTVLHYCMGPRLSALVRLAEALIDLGEVDPRAARLARRLQRKQHGSRRRKKKRRRA